MAKTSNLYARIEPDVKDQAESILATLGISASSAISMFYKQIILKRGIPFDIKLPVGYVPSMGSLSEEQLDAEFEKGYQDILAGRAQPVDKVFESIRKDFGI